MIPGQGHPSEYGHPPLSLVLHYILTAYGATDDNGLVNDTRSHFLLGSAMRVLHDNAEITELLRTEQPPTGVTLLHESLRGEFERVKVCLDPTSLEDLSKIWTALTRPFRVSAAYTVSVVQIESRRIKTLAAPSCAGESTSQLRSDRRFQPRIARPQHPAIQSATYERTSVTS